MAAKLALDTIGGRQACPRPDRGDAKDAKETQCPIALSAQRYAEVVPPPSRGRLGGGWVGGRCSNPIPTLPFYEGRFVKLHVRCR